MLKNYAIGSTLFAFLLSVGASAQSPKPQPSTEVLRAQWQPSLTLSTEYNDYRGGGGDNCAAANPLTVGASCTPATFDAFSATQSQAPILCNGFTSPAANDLWFSFQATTPNTTITVTGLGDFDAVIEYFSGSCGSLTSLGCIDNTFPPASTVETGTIGTTVGQTYYIRVYYYSSPLPTNYQFTICLVGAGGGGGTPPNDLCTGAVPQNLNAGSTVNFTGNNTGATLLAGTTFVVVWEAFTTTECTNVTLNYCVPGSVFENFLINLTNVCPDVLTGLVAGTNTDCEVTFTQLPAGTWYIPVLVDAATTPVGAYTISASAVACPAGYCAAGATSVDFEKIANVTFSNINNSSTAVAGYEDFTAIVGTVQTGQSYAFSLTIEEPYEADQVLVWIDLDQSDSFEPNELLFSTTPPQLDENVSGTITIPGTATIGQTRMRIRLHDSELGGNAGPCGTSTYGQVEDYTLDITGGGGTTPPNDECGGAVVQNLNVGSTVSFSGDNTGANLLAGTNFRVVWEAFTTTECATVVVNYCVPGFVFDDFLINLATNCPGVLTGLVTGSNTNCEVTFTELPAGTYYIPVLVDAALTPVGPYTISATATACPAGYCSAGATSLDFEKIANVTFSNINNNSTSTAGYEDFTAVVGNVEAGQSYAFSLTIEEPYEADQVLVWIDLDQSETFEPSELVFSTTPPQADENVSGTITIPVSATTGQTRMRIRLHDSELGGNAGPCGTSTYGQVEDYTLNITGGVAVCDADAGTLSGGTTVCLVSGEATLTATADGNANVPAGYSTVYVLTEGAGLVIVQAGATPEFVVDAEGDYTIHTLVYDAATLDLGIVEFGVTTGFDVNGLLIQGGGEICASLDVAGAPFTVEICPEPCDADAGTLSGGTIVCLENDEATLTATADGNANVPAGYSTVYVLTEGAGLVIVQAGATPEFVVDAEGNYTIHTLVYDATTLDLGIVEFGVTTGFDVNGLLIQGGGEICASLDVAGASFEVLDCTGLCLVEAGTLSGGGTVCFEDGAATLTATPDGNAVVLNGYSTVYVLTEGAGLVIVQAGATPQFVVDAEGDYTIHTLVYDPTTLDLGIVEFGVTTGFDVNGLLIQGGGDICASLDVAGAAFTVEICPEPCLADAGTLSGGDTVCLVDDEATLTATAEGNANVPAGYSTVYVLTEGAGLVIVQAGATPEFVVDAEGDYTIHTLVYDPATLDLGIVEFGVTTGFDVNGLLIQGGGDICASLDVAGAAYTVEICVVPCDADAGTLNGGGNVCFEIDEATLAATAAGNAVVPAGYSTVYVLTQGAGLVIVQTAATPEFVVNALGTYTIHTLVYDAATLDLGIVVPGVTTGFDVNGLLVQGGGDICASLDVAGAAFNVQDCTFIGENNGVDVAVFPNPSNGDFAIRYGANGPVAIDILDVSGRLVHNTQRTATANEVMQVQLGGRLAPGTYILRMSTNEGSNELRIVVQ